MRLSDIHKPPAFEDEDAPLTFRQQHFLDGILKAKAAYERHPVWFVLWRWVFVSAAMVGACWFLVGLEPWVRANVPAGGPGLPADWVHPLAVASNPLAWLVNLGLPLLMAIVARRVHNKALRDWADPVVAARRMAAELDTLEKGGMRALVSWKIWGP